MRKGRIEEDLQGFKNKVQESKSFAELGRKLGYKPSGGVHKFLRQKIEEHGLDIDHFTGQGWAKGKIREEDSSVNKFACGIERPWDEIFCMGSKVKNSVLLRRLIVEEKKEYRCEICGVRRWNNEPLRLQVDHINGDGVDNREDNLMVVCPNCHSQTPTFSRGTRGRTKLRYAHVWWKRLSMN